MVMADLQPDKMEAGPPEASLEEGAVEGGRKEDGEGTENDEGEDEDPSDYSSEEEVEQLAFGREKRATAGNLMQTLLNQEGLDHETAEPDEEDVEYDSDQDKQEDIIDSDFDQSSSDENKEPEDAGEKELVKQQRHENRSKKRQKNVVQPLFRGRSKPVSTAERRPKRPKIELTPDQVRSSSRKHTIQAKEVVQEKMREEQQKRSRPQVRIQEKAKSQQERLREALETEEKNLSSLNKYTEIEEERRIAREKQSAQDKIIREPLIRYWSGRVEFKDSKWVKQVDRSDAIQEDARGPVEGSKRPLEEADAEIAVLQNSQTNQEGATNNKVNSESNAGYPAEIAGKPSEFANFVIIANLGRDERHNILPPNSTEALNKRSPGISCISGKTCRFRDPRTGLGYHDLEEYGMIKRIESGQFQWSQRLESFVTE